MTKDTDKDNIQVSGKREQKSSGQEAGARSDDGTMKMHKVEGRKEVVGASKDGADGSKVKDKIQVEETETVEKIDVTRTGRKSMKQDEEPPSKRDTLKEASPLGKGESPKPDEPGRSSPVPPWKQAQLQAKAKAEGQGKAGAVSPNQPGSPSPSPTPGDKPEGAAAPKRNWTPVKKKQTQVKQEEVSNLLLETKSLLKKRTTPAAPPAPKPVSLFEDPK